MSPVSDIKTMEELVSRLGLLQSAWERSGFKDAADEIRAVIRYLQSVTFPGGGDPRAPSRVGTPQPSEEAIAGSSSVPASPLPLELFDGQDIQFDAQLQELATYAQSLHHLGRLSYKSAQRRGFEEAHWGDWAGMGLTLAKIHREVSEAFEIIEKPNPDPGKFAIELADVIMRTTGFAYFSCPAPISIALVDKYGYNQTRPYRHGGRNF